MHLTYSSNMSDTKQLGILFGVTKIGYFERHNKKFLNVESALFDADQYTG